MSGNPVRKQPVELSMFVQRTRSALFVSGLIALLGGFCTLPHELAACPFCFGSLQLTLREQIETTDATVIVLWKAGEAGNLDTGVPASTTFEILNVLKGDLTVDESLTIDRYQQGKPGDVFLMSANRLEDALRWDRSLPLSAEGLEYLQELPPASVSMTERLRYAVQFLESADDLVATDAFTVMAAARYEDLVVLRADLPREKLRHWVFEQDKIKGQLGVYGMLLGLCGDASDGQRFESMILDTRGREVFRLGMGGVMGGYLLLAKADGLELLEREFLRNPAASKNDRAATMEALRFIGQYAEDCISQRRLSQSVRRILRTTPLPELAITDLARWHDWTVADELIEWYGDREHCDKYVRNSIIRFMLAASQTERDGLSAEERAAVEAATRFIERLQKEEPAQYQRAARSLIPFS